MVAEVAVVVAVGTVREDTDTDMDMVVGVEVVEAGEAGDMVAGEAVVEEVLVVEVDDGEARVVAALAPGPERATGTIDRSNLVLQSTGNQPI